MTTVPIDIEAIEKRCNAATKGPWTHDNERCRLFDDPSGRSVAVTGGWQVPHKPDDGKADGQFIAHARTDIPALLAEVKALRQQVAGQRDREIRIAQYVIDNAADLANGIMSNDPESALVGFEEDLKDQSHG